MSGPDWLNAWLGEATASQSEAEPGSSGTQSLQQKEPGPDSLRAWLNEVRQARHERRSAAAPTDPSLATAGPGSTTAYGKAALAGELAKLGATPEGARNDQLNKDAFEIGRLVAGGNVDETEARQAFTTKARERT
jgi:hypothetical protein